MKKMLFVSIFVVILIFGKFIGGYYSKSITIYADAAE